MGIRQPTSDEPDSGERSGRRGSGPGPGPYVLASLLGILALLGLASQIQYFVDDAFITFRYARNWAEWGLPVFNSFEVADSPEIIVEGYSNFAWMTLLAVAHKVGFALETVTPVLQALIGALTIVLVAVRGTRVAGLSPRGPWAAALLLGTSAPFVAWTTGGMETGLLGLLVTAWFLGLLDFMGAAPKPRRTPLLTLLQGLRLGAIGAALALVRVEGLAWVLGVFLAVIAGEMAMGGALGRRLLERRWALALALLIIMGTFFSHLLMRLVVYGDVVPNTVAAKTGGANSEVWARGARQLASWALVSVTPVAALLALPFALRHPSPRARAVGLAAFFAVLGFSGYNVATGGDWMPFFRFLAPASPILALLVVIGLDAMGPRIAMGLAVGLAALQPLALFDVHLAPLSVRSSLRFRAFRGGYRTERTSIDTAIANAQYFGTLGKALALSTQPADILAFGAIGSPGWYAKDLDFVDRNGLVTPSVSRREVQLGDGTAGHEKRVPHAWFLDHGSPEPNLLYAKILKGPMGSDPTVIPQGLKDLLRRDPVIGRPAEAELFQRTVLRAVPFAPGGTQGPQSKTLLLLERASPEEAARFWSR